MRKLVHVQSCINMQERAPLELLRDTVSTSLDDPNNL